MEGKPGSPDSSGEHLRLIEDMAKGVAKPRDFAQEFRTTIEEVLGRDDVPDSVVVALVEKYLAAMRDEGTPIYGFASAAECLIEKLREEESADRLNQEKINNYLAEVTRITKEWFQEKQIRQPNGSTE